MTKLLEQAIAKVRELPEEEQDALAAVMLSMAGADASGLPLDKETEAAVREGLAQAERGEFVPDEVVAESQQTPRHMRVRYTPRAFADREAIFEYINRRNPRAAREVKAFIERRISELGDLEIRHRMIPSACPLARSLSVHRLLSSWPRRNRDCPHSPCRA